MDSTEVWRDIKSEYGLTKRELGKRINFIGDDFARKIIFRDIEQAYLLSKKGFSKPAVVLAGGVIEELLRRYILSKNVPLNSSSTFNDYIQTCIDNRLLKSAIGNLSHSVRYFRNLVHLQIEQSKRHTISLATAKGAVSSIFTIANDFDNSRS